MTQSRPALLNLADLSSRIDIKGFYESQGVAIHGRPTASKEGHEWHGNCPECGGEDRFAFWSSGRFSCSLRSSGCSIHGSSPYWFLREVKGYSHSQALEDLGIDQEEIGDSYSQPAPKLPLFLLKDEPPNKKWMESAHAFCQACEKILRSSNGESARAYLQSRGFTDETIQAAHIGLCPDWFKQPWAEWGLSSEQLGKEEGSELKIPRGIVIPWYVNGNIWKIQLRRPEGGYFEVLGSSECLYSLAPIEGRPVLLVESEFDALSVYQEAGDLVTAVATGGVYKGRIPGNMALLKRASRVLQGFDADEPGERAASEWAGYLPVIRHAPEAHDVNDMLKDDPEILRDWVEVGLSNCEPEQGETLEESAVFDRAGKEIPPALIKTVPDLVARVLKFQDDCLAKKKICCDTLDWEIDADGYLICPCVTKARNANRLLDIRIAQEKAGNRSPVDLDW